MTTKLDGWVRCECGYVVRIERTEARGNDYVFRAELQTETVLEMVALDSKPSFIAFVNALDPGAACARAWQMAIHMHDEPNKQLEPP